MKVLLLAVNYNAEEALMDYLLSMEEALGEVDNLSLKIFIVDNSDTPIEWTHSFGTLEIQYVFTGENLGYLGAISYAIEKGRLVLKEYDYFILSNVDVTMDKSFLKVLSMLNVDSDVAWIAPSIYSDYEKRDRNPQRICRPTQRRLKLISYLYKYSFLDWLYSNTLYRLKSKEHTKVYEIYAGHGSFMIFTRNLANIGFQLKFPSFLFGEELYLAEIIRNAGMKSVYIPSLKIYDKDHISTGKLKKDIYYRWNYESIIILIESFWKDGE